MRQTIFAVLTIIALTVGFVTVGGSAHARFPTQSYPYSYNDGG